MTETVITYIAEEKGTILIKKEATESQGRV